MRAIAIDGFETTPTPHDVPIPEPGPGDVLVRVQASSINGFDRSVVSGGVKDMMEHRFPLILGMDFAGTIEGLGSGASRFAIGNRVFGVALKPVLGAGAFAEHVAVSESFGIARIPDGLDLPFAGALGLAGTAALMAVDAVAPVAGETVLVSGAKGGVGAIAIQLAVARGAEVIATARPGADADFVRGLGAAHVIDYGTDLAAAVRAIRAEGVHAILHFAGDGQRLADLLVENGRIASTMGLRPEQLAGRPVDVAAIMAVPTTERLDQLAGEAAAGRLVIPIQRTYRLEQVHQALDDFAAGTRGKLAIAID